MPTGDPFLQLAVADRREALEYASGDSGRPAHLLEKDIWVVWALRSLFMAPFGPHLVFKGGTSLSKAYKAIRRFSEDVDLTYDIREIAGDLVGTGPEPIPSTASKAKKWAEAIRERLAKWIAGTALPTIDQTLQQERLPAEARLKPGDPFAVQIAYERSVDASNYVAATVLLEFGAKSTGEPCDQHLITCDAAKQLTSLTFPEAQARVMRVERTFWEKATAIHVICLDGKLRTERFSRHLYDLVKLEDAGLLNAALSSREVAVQVAKHKQVFFSEKDGNGNRVDYSKAVSGALQLVPTGEHRKTLDLDYAKMVEDGLFEEEPPSFEQLLERCKGITECANAAAK